MIKTAFQEDAVSHTEVFNRFCHFREGRTSEESDGHSGHPSMNRKNKVTAKLWDMVTEDQSLIIRKMAEQVEISSGTGQSILTEDLGISNACCL